ncbi:putative Activator of spomin::LUC2 [Tripterygium wilfordii]|uniref:Putative Activator of spomin::LUC2 n=1 Tax=Tripterygium wilfordii TaxID=458696 RepID=A0A7J7CAR0_TRIWF|nr:uncharacterized protein LOC119984966 [Tripterygium wilfordii]KAF5730826.1 putative Activator of spomin::LUC2 [Tripterygium wilfordii]
MASPIPQFYPNYPFSGDYSPFSTPLLAEETLGGAASSSGTISSGGGAMWGEDNLYPSYLDNGGSDIGVFQPKSDVSSSFLPTPFPERLGLSNNMAVPAALPKYDMGLESIAQVQNFNGGGFQSPDLSEFAEECYAYIPDFKPIFPITGDNWEIKCNHAPEAEDTSMKVRRYSIEERKDRIIRYLNKRSKRNFNKTIKYACRKTLADRRVRVRGRFARNNDRLMGEDDMRMEKKENSTQKCNGILYNSDTLQIRSDDEDWLQEAMASLMYIPYISG